MGWGCLGDGGPWGGCLGEWSMGGCCLGKGGRGVGLSGGQWPMGGAVWGMVARGGAVWVKVACAGSGSLLPLSWGCVPKLILTAPAAIQEPHLCPYTHSHRHLPGLSHILLLRENLFKCNLTPFLLQRPGHVLSLETEPRVTQALSSPERAFSSEKQAPSQSANRPDN